MTTETQGTNLEPDLFGVIRDRWILIVGLAIVFGLVGLFVGSARTVEYESTASVVVEDPSTSAIFESSSNSRPERYVETQLGIMGSPAVAEKASELLASDLSPDEILGGSTITSQDSSDLISVSFSSEDPEKAEAAADAIIEAYLELRSSEAVAGFASALAKLDDSIGVAENQLEMLAAQIESARGSDLFELRAQAAELTARLVELRDAEGAADNADEIAALNEQLQAIETVFRLEGLQPELSALLEDQRLAQARLSELRTRRSEVTVDAELAGGGFVFQTQATPALRTDPSPRAYAAIAAVIGLMMGVAAAYALAIWRRRVSSPEQPEAILQTPSLGTIPDFDVILRSPLPVANAPQSRSAEAFRFVMAAMESQLFRPGSSQGSPAERLVLVTSASADDGRSTIVANTAIAAARSGRRVLVVDADFVTQGVTELLRPETSHTAGMSEVLMGARTLESAIVQTEVTTGADLSLLSRGSDLMQAEDIFGTLEAGDLLNSLRERYDLVLVDSPPLSTIGYATTLARLADRVLVVVRHRTQVAKLEELGQRLSLIQSRKLGYVYNRAPAPGEPRRNDRAPAQKDEASPFAPAVPQ